MWSEDDVEYEENQKDVQDYMWSEDDVEYEENQKDVQDKAATSSSFVLTTKELVSMLVDK